MEQQALQEGALRRNVMGLVVSHLKENNLMQVAAAVANATMTPLDVENPPNRLLELVQKGLAAEGASGRGPFSASFPTRQAQNKRMGKIFPKVDSQNVGDHKGAARCARFSRDGRYFASGGADASVKLFEVEKVQQVMMTQLKPIIRTFFDHSQPINDLDFHPQSILVASASKDKTIRLFDVVKSSARRAVKLIQDTHNVRSVCFHPSGDFLVAGTDHPIPHLYDVNTLQGYISSNSNVGGAINQVRYSEDGGMYVTASKDGGIRIWDGKNSRCIRAIQGAHVSAEATSAYFTKDQKSILTCGKDYAVVLWDVGTGKQLKRYIGAQHSQTRSQAVFSHNEEFVLSADEPKSEIVVWDALTGELASRIMSNHSGSLRWVEHSPIEACFVSCGNDRSVRFWQVA